MSQLPHLKLNVKKQSDPSISHKFNYGGGKDEEEDKNYLPMANTFKNSLRDYFLDRSEREANRNVDLKVPAYIEYIQITFQGQFDIKKYNQSWYTQFGLEAVRFTNFNKTGLFAVVDQDKFKEFFLQIRAFIKSKENQDKQIKFDTKVLFLEEFKLFTSKDISNFSTVGKVMLLDLFQFPLGTDLEGQIFERLSSFLNEKGIDFSFDENVKLLEVYEIDDVTINEIADNFDIVYSITSALATRVGPSELNTPKKDYGFTVKGGDNLPIIGILDTGISGATPLKSIIVDDDEFNLSQESPLEDGVNHGTAVAALAALGRKPYLVDYRGEIESDARVLNLKIGSANKFFLSVFGVLHLLRKAKSKYPEIKIFVLVTCFSESKKTNEPSSIFAYELDKFSNENDCLVCICTANNNKATDLYRDYNLKYFGDETSFLCSPAESMNNLVVGAAADNFKQIDKDFVTQNKEWPALYSRSSHIDIEKALKKKKTKKFVKHNPNLFRPDVIAPGGDYEFDQYGWIAQGEKASLEVLSSNPAEGFYKQIGTSFATPIVANLAVRLQRNYPSLRAQTLKALIINGADNKLIKVEENELKKLIPKSAGHGLIDDEMSLYSNENAMTIIIEDSIQNDELKVYPLYLPESYTKESLNKKQGILNITATLCFSFDPVKDIHGAYCPLHMGFSIFKNHTADQILQSANTEKGGINSILKKRWSQNNRFKSQPIPASNTQKISFPVDVKNLKEEECIFKLAIHCLLSDHIIDSDKYMKEHPFSIVVTIEESLKKGNERHKLYEEMQAINELENISILEIDAEGDLEI